MMLSGMLMLRHLEEVDAADRLERALAAVIAEGKSVTYDMKPSRDDPTAVGTSQVADAVIAKLDEGSGRRGPGNPEGVPRSMGLMEGSPEGRGA
jgi:Isocitrate/isopropylmalate dehydrogenase